MTRSGKKFWHFALILVALFSGTQVAAAQSGRVAPTVTPTPRDDDTERVLTEEIKLNVLAFDDKGQFVKDVTANDLVITENNILHPPESVRRLPANVLIVLDTGGEMRSVKSLDQTRRVARGLVEALRPGDSVAVMQYSDKAEILSELTSNKAEALAAIDRAKFGRRSAFVDALNLAADYFRRDGIENKHIVLITDGTDSMASPSAKFDAIQSLKTTDISVHVLSYTALEAVDLEPRTKRVSNNPPPKPMPDEVAAQLPNGARDIMTTPRAKTINMDRTMIKNLKSRKLELELSEKDLEKLAAQTNGEFILPGSIDEMADKSALVARMIDSAYVVTYTPKVAVVDTRGLSERNIEVTSKRPGLVVQARRNLLIARSN